MNLRKGPKVALLPSLLNTAMIFEAVISNIVAISSFPDEETDF